MAYSSFIFYREVRIADHYLRPLSESYIEYLTAMRASRRSLFNRNGLVDRSFIGGLALKKAPNSSLVRSADRDSQDKNLVGSLDRFAKTAGSRDLVDSILTHVYPFYSHCFSCALTEQSFFTLFLILHPLDLDK